MATCFPVAVFNSERPPYAVAVATDETLILCRFCADFTTAKCYLVTVCNSKYSSPRAPQLATDEKLEACATITYAAGGCAFSCILGRILLLKTVT